MVALVDNNKDLIGSVVDSYVVEDPRYIWKYSYDYVVITSNYAVEMKQQLIDMGIEREKLIHYKDYIGSFPLDPWIVQTDSLENSVLILSNKFGYHGGPIACLSLAHVLIQRGYNVTIAVPQADSGFVDEISSMDLRVIVVENLDYLSMENLKWTDRYDYIFANTIVMARCAIKLAKKRKVYLWLHESVDSYADYEYWHEEIVEEIKNDSLIIGAVSDVAKKNFFSIYKIEKTVSVMPYGIEDKCKKKDVDLTDGIMTFAVVANHIPLKGLDVLFAALTLLPKEAKLRIRVLIAGKTYDNDYGNRIKYEITQNNSCTYLGELSREKIFELYDRTDVVIIPSRRDSLPIVATEAMMLKKTCIISDSIGTAKYIKHKFNGLVFKNEDIKELSKAINWCLENRRFLKTIAENARKTYEESFTMEKFGDRVAAAIECLK